MLEQILRSYVPTVVQVIELIGVSIIAIGAVITLLQFLWAAAKRRDMESSVACLRTNLGRVILVGLELLVAADIIQTVLVELNIENVASLAGIVIIRTLLSFSLEAEIEGRWPWQRGERRPEEPRA